MGKNFVPRVCKNVALTRTCFGLFVWLIITACGSAERDQKQNEQEVDQRETLDEGVDHSQENRHRARNADRERDQKKTRRSRHRKQLQKWASQHIYMDVTLKNLKLSEDQFTKITEMNWRHFEALLEKKNKRPLLEQELLKMLSTGTVDEQAFQKYRSWIEEEAALRETQYRERMTTLHKTLTEKQRGDLVKFVAAEQKKRDAKVDKLPAANRDRRPRGCGGRGNYFSRQFTEGLQLKKEQQKKMRGFYQQVQQKNPSVQELDEHRKARAVYDTVVRKTFVLGAFDVSKILRPKLEYSDPVRVSLCNQQEFQMLLETLTAEQRQAAAQVFQSHLAKRTGANSDAGVD